MQLLDSMIRTGRLTEFVDEFIEIHNEEMTDETTWAIWLHKTIEMSYPEFRQSLGIDDHTAAAPPPQEVIQSTVMESKKILSGFVLSDKGVKQQNGDIPVAGNNSNRRTAGE